MVVRMAGWLFGCLLGWVSYWVVVFFVFMADMVVG